MISLIFYTDDNTINVEYKIDAISLNQSQVQVLDVVGLDAAELTLGFRFNLLDYSLGSFKKFAEDNDLQLKAIGQNITTTQLNTVVATGIQVIPESIEVNKSDDPFTLNVISLPVGTVLGDTVTYMSDDKTVCTVDSEGEVTVVDGGTCTITATCGEFTDTCDVTVVEDAVITLTSAVGTNAQTPQADVAITDITYEYEETLTSVAWTGTAGASTPPTGITVDIATPGEITIAGTPSVTGNYGYTITIAGEEGGVVATAEGTLVVSIDASITLTSAEDTDAQSVAETVAITDITYGWEGGKNTITWTATADPATPPVGITVDDTAGVITITGTPTTAGEYGYTIDVTGDNNITTDQATGTITVTE